MNTAKVLTQSLSKGIPFEILRAYGISDEIINIWKDSYGECFLPVQEKAIVKHNVLGGKNLIIFAPTSSGKTLVGEIVSVHYAMAKKRALYLVPMKALAEEKYHHFKEMYGELGIETIISTHDRKEYDQDLERKEFDIAVVVFEKFNSLLISNPNLLQGIGLIVIDELQMMGDETRGAGLELLLTKMLLSPYKPQLLGLSAVLGDGEDLACWLRAELLVETSRPVELRKGVLSRGVFSYLEHNSGTEGEEKWPLPEPDEDDLSALYAAKYFAEGKGEQSIIFLPDKPATEAWGEKLKDMVDLSPATGAILELKTFEDSYSRDLLLSFFSHGIAIHNADLSWEERDVVERYYRKGGIRILLSTSTLAMGINLPARNVFIPEKKWNTPRTGNQLAMTDISKAEHENMGGRAGRLGFVDEFGRAILVTSSPFHKKAFYDYYVKGGFEKLKPALNDQDIDLYCLDLVASGICSHEETIKNFLLSTYTGVSCWNGVAGRDLREVLAERVQKIIEKCLNWGLLKRDVQERLQVTERGKVTAQMGISIDTCLNLIKWMDLCDPLRVSELEILVAAALTEDAKAIHIPLPKGEFRRSKYRNLFAQEVQNLGESDKTLFKSILGPSHRLQYEQERALKKALVLYHWISSAPTKEIEEAHHLFFGAIKKMGEEFSWLVEAISTLAKAEGWPEQVINKMNLLGDRVSFGVDEQGLEPAKLRIPGLGRGYIARLIKEGYDSARALAEATPEALAELVPADIAKRIALKFNHATEPKRNQKLAKEVKTAVAPITIQKKITDAILVLDRQHPGTIEFQGKGVKLTSKQFWLLTALAESPGKCVSYDALYNKVWGDEVSVELQQLSYHKSQLLKKLSRVTPTSSAKTLITPVSGEGMVLNLRPEEIAIGRA
jgi:ATP-dependent DNA helicase